MTAAMTAMTTTGAIGTQIGIADVIGIGKTTTGMADVIGIGTTPTGMTDVTGIGTTPTGTTDVTGNRIWNASVSVTCGTKRTGFVTTKVDPASAGPGNGAETRPNNQLDRRTHTVNQSFNSSRIRRQGEPVCALAR
jgi:hypothetical protein